jgi:hypothetical protein
MLNEQNGLYVTDAATGQLVRVTAGTSGPKGQAYGWEFFGSNEPVLPEQISADPFMGQAATIAEAHTFDAVIRIFNTTKGLVAGLLNGDTFTNGTQVKGIGMGVGTTTFDTNGSNLLGLNENVAWVTPSLALPVGRPVHIGMVYYGPSKTGYWYIDGRPAASSSWGAIGTGTSTSPLRFLVGGYFNNGLVNRVFTGDIFTARHWNRALLPQEMAALAARPYAMMAPLTSPHLDAVASASWHTSVVKVWK